MCDKGRMEVKKKDGAEREMRGEGAERRRQAREMEQEDGIEVRVGGDVEAEKSKTTKMEVISLAMEHDSWRWRRCGRGERRER